MGYIEGSYFITNKRTEPVIRFLYEPYERYYDNIRFIRRPAERLVTHAKLSKGQRILDVACGTGLATIMAVKAVGNTGKVTGIDIDEKWLIVAKEKAASGGYSNIEYHVGNAEELEFDNDGFDVVICASSIFYFKDIIKALQEWYRVLKVGGTVAFSSFGPEMWQPVLKPLGECLSRYDSQPPPVPFFIKPTNTPEKCKAFIENAGFEDIKILTEQLDCQYPDKETYWHEITLSFVGPRLARLSSANLAKLKAEHFAELESLYAGQDIVIKFPTYISVAKKPSV